MGMYDTIRCEMPLPDGERYGFDSTTQFQSKSLECFLDHLLITSDGQLVREVSASRERAEPLVYNINGKEFSIDYEHYLTGEVEPYLEQVHHGVGDLPFHGYISFYDHSVREDTFVSYLAKFTDGICDTIQLLKG